MVTSGQCNLTTGRIASRAQIFTRLQPVSASKTVSTLEFCSLHLAEMCQHSVDTSPSYFVRMLFLDMRCDWLTQRDASRRCVAATLSAYNVSPLPPPTKKNSPIAGGGNLHSIESMVPWTQPNHHPKRHLDRFSRFCGAHKRCKHTDQPRCVCRNRLVLTL